MPTVRNFLKYWLPVLVWMSLIFTASSDAGSSQHSSRIIGPLVRWLYPQISAASLEQIIFVVRKCAHLTEFAILGMLLWRAIRKPRPGDVRPWQWSQFWMVVLLAFCYAGSDEIHQLFVPTREGRFEDVLIDTSGATLGLLVLWLGMKWRGSRRRDEIPAADPAAVAAGSRESGPEGTS